MSNTSSQSALRLRNLYFVRTVLQIAWAGLLAINREHPPAVAALLVFYPLWDVACTVYDLKTSAQNTDARGSQLLNIALGLVTALAIGLTISTNPGYAVAAFGTWAFVAGALQLAAGLLRRKKLGGQWAMILSGAQSVLAGIAFILGGLSGKRHATDLGGYAIFGAVYFLIAGVFLHRKLSQMPVAGIEAAQ